MKLSIRSISHNIVLAYDLFTNRKHDKIEPLSVKSYGNKKVTIINESKYYDPIYYNTRLIYRYLINDILRKHKEINLKKSYTSIFKRGVRIRFYGEDL